MKIQTSLILFISLTAHAKNLSELNVAQTCSPQELATEPLSQKKVFAEARWSEKLNAKYTQNAFDPAHVRKLSDKIVIVRDDLSSAHMSQHLADAIKGLRSKQLELVAKGELIPPEQDQTYTQAELEKRIASVDEFRRKHLFPMLESNYQLYLRILHERKARTSLPADQAFKDLVERQRSILNQNLQKILPEAAQKLGTISEFNEVRPPFSYRDGYIVKIRLRTKDSHTVLLYPRLLLNRLNDEDQYFIEALKLWRDYTKTQYEKAVKDGSPQFELKRRVLEIAEHDLDGAIRTQTLLATLTQHELLSLMDLFRALNPGHIPQCESQIRKLNQLMTSKLGGLSSRKLKPAQRAQAEAIAKDVVFYQDFYDVFSRVPGPESGRGAFY